MFTLDKNNSKPSSVILYLTTSVEKIERMFSFSIVIKLDTFMKYSA